MKKKKTEENEDTNAKRTGRVGGEWGERKIGSCPRRGNNLHS